MDAAPKPEVKKPVEKIHDFLNLSPEDKEKLRKRIEKWNGLVRIIVHPLYENWRSDQDEDMMNDHPYREDIVEVEKVLSRLISLDESKTPPLIIMEEKDNIPKLIAWLKAVSKPIQENIYSVATLPNNPTPGIEKVSQEEIISNTTRYDPRWKALEKALEEIGVKKILLGGMQFQTSVKKNDWTNKHPWVGFCIGIAMSHLAKDKGGKFELELSALTAPFSERRHFAHLKSRKQEKSRKASERKLLRELWQKMQDKK